MTRHVPLVLASIAFFLTSASGIACFDLDDDACESDADCPGDSVCDVGVGCDAGARCTFEPTCSSDEDCPIDEECVVRAAEEPEHPFDEPIPERGFCEPCEDFTCRGGSGGGWGTGGASGMGGGL